MSWFGRFFGRLRWKLTAAYAGFTAVAVVVVTLAATGLLARQTIYASPVLGVEFADDLRAAVSRLRSLLPFGADDVARVEGILADVLDRDVEPAEDLTVPLREHNVVFLGVFDESGRVVAALPAGSAAPGSSVRDVLPAAGDVVVNDILVSEWGFDRNWGERDERTRHVFLGSPIQWNEEIVGGIVLEFRPTLRDVLDAVARIVPTSTVRTGLLVVALFSILAGLLFGFLSARWITRRLSAFTVAAERWQDADFSSRIPDRSQDELGGLARNLNRMAEDLRTHLETRAGLAAVEERNRVARDLHDAVKQQVFAASLQIGTARASLRRSPDEALGPLARAEALTREAGHELTRLIRELRPAELEGRGLLAALREQAARWSGAHGIAAGVRARGERATPLEAEQALFRVAQEALNNVARHSGARRVDILLTWTDETLTLEVIDDGRGFEGASTGGSGIRNMRERTEAVGGTLTAGGPAGAGRVTARVPASRTGEGAP